MNMSRIPPSDNKNDDIEDNIDPIDDSDISSLPAEALSSGERMTPGALARSILTSDVDPVGDWSELPVLSEVVEESAIDGLIGNAEYDEGLVLEEADDYDHKMTDFETQETFDDEGLDLDNAIVELNEVFDGLDEGNDGFESLDSGQSALEVTDVGIADDGLDVENVPISGDSIREGEDFVIFIGSSSNITDNYKDMPGFDQLETVDQPSQSILIATASEQPVYDKAIEVIMPDFPSLTESAFFSRNENDELTPFRTTGVTTDIADTTQLSFLEAKQAAAAEQTVGFDQAQMERLIAQLSDAVSERIFTALPLMIEATLTMLQDDQQQVIALATEAALKEIGPLLVASLTNLIRAQSAYGGIERVSLVEATLASMRDELQANIDQVTRQTLEEFIEANKLVHL